MRLNSNSDEPDDINWRNKNRTQAERIEYLFQTGLYSDVTFSLGSKCELIRGHQVFLMAGSQVFENLIQNWCGNPEKPIQIPHIEPYEFRIVQKFLYTGVKEGAGGGENCQNILPLFRAAKFFQVDELVEGCVDKILSELDYTNVFSIYETGVAFGVQQLIDVSKEFINRNACTILKRSEYLQLSEKNLCHFLSSDDFQAQDELQICLAAHKWGAEECERQCLEKSPENMRIVMKKIIPLIRFSYIDPAEFAMKVALLNILKSDELIYILLSFNIPKTSRSVLGQIPCYGRFNSRPRKYLSLDNK